MRRKLVKYCDSNKSSAYCGQDFRLGVALWENDKMETLTGKESIWYKEAIRFCRNSGKKSKKRKEVRFTLDDYDKGNICEETAIIRINLTKPWQNHAPINP